MTDSGVRLLALTILFPILVVVALAVALIGCDAQLSVMRPAQALATVTSPFGIAVDSTTIYVSQVAPAPLMTLPLGGGAASPLGVQAEGHGLAVDERRLYWSDGHSLLACDRSNCTGSDPIEPMGIALDGDNVYFANGAGTVFEVPKNGGPTQVVLSNLGQFPAGLATDATNLYVAASTKVVSIPLGGGAARTLATGLAGAGGIALDATSVYVTDDDGDAVVRVAK